MGWGAERTDRVGTGPETMRVRNSYHIFQLFHSLIYPSGVYALPTAWLQRDPAGENTHWDTTLEVLSLVPLPRWTHRYLGNSINSSFIKGSGKRWNKSYHRAGRSSFSSAPALTGLTSHGLCCHFVTRPTSLPSNADLVLLAVGWGKTVTIYHLPRGSNSPHLKYHQEKKKKCNTRTQGLYTAQQILNFTPEHWIWEARPDPLISSHICTPNNITTLCTRAERERTRGRAASIQAPHIRNFLHHHPWLRFLKHFHYQWGGNLPQPALHKPTPNQETDKISTFTLQDIKAPQAPWGGEMCSKQSVKSFMKVTGQQPRDRHGAELL